MIVEAAWLYYYEDRTQNEIAGSLGVSRSSVATYLQQARAMGLVEVRLAPSLFNTRIVARDLQQKYGLQEVVVAPGPEGSLDRVAQLAARRLPDLLEAGDWLGVSWGQTVWTVAQKMARRPIDDLSVVQLVGAMRTPYGFDSTNCAALIASAVAGRVVNLHAPAILSSAAVADALRNEEIIARQINALSEINKVIFAAGSVEDDSHIVLCGIATPDDLREYRARGAVGMVCGRFIDRDGNHIEGSLDPRMIGVLPQTIKGLSVGMMVSVGADKIQSMDAALQGGYATHLVTDLPTALGILGLGNSSP